MTQEGIDPWEYLSMHIIPNQDPSFVGTERDYAKHQELLKNKNLS